MVGIVFGGLCAPSILTQLKYTVWAEYAMWELSLNDSYGGEC